MSTLNHILNTYIIQEHFSYARPCQLPLEHADKLKKAVSDLQALRSLLEDLDARTAIHLPPLELSHQQGQAITSVRAAILRAAIALAVAILDSKGRDRAIAEFW